ncbi:MAG: metallophosphoesterase, partial [Actinomycetes bacterium]|nr:metallophosphoesterase [Actinomycetes bacterium]
MSAFRSAALLASAGATALGWGLTEAARVFRVRRHSVPIFPAGSADLRVLHVSDLHLLPRQRERVAFTRGLADLEPDLVVSTGDSMASRGGLATSLEALDPLLALPGVF